MNAIRTSNGLFVTECICYPRSGHHMLQDVLSAYFGDAIVYAEIYRHPELAIEKNPATNLQKNHDFTLDTPILTDRKYIIQIRDPLDALASRWELDTRTGQVPSSMTAYHDVVKQWITYWQGFFLKWVAGDIPNRLVVRYRDLIDDPIDVLQHVIHFMQGYQNTDNQKLRTAIANAPPTSRRQRQLPYCDFA